MKALGTLLIAAVLSTALHTQGDEDVLPANPEGGTIEIAGAQVVIRYSEDGAPQQLVYDVVPAR